MRLSPRELDHLQLAQAGFVAQKRLSRGLRLNHPETVSLISTVLMELIRDGEKSAMELENIGGTLLGHQQILPGVGRMVPEVQIESTFPDGTKLVTVHNPIRSEHGGNDSNFNTPLPFSDEISSRFSPTSYLSTLIRPRLGSVWIGATCSISRSLRNQSRSILSSNNPCRSSHNSRCFRYAQRKSRPYPTSCDEQRRSCHPGTSHQQEKTHNNLE